jgi:hypothetical protein
MMAVPLEDSWQDIVGKACRGLNITHEQLAQQTSLTAETVAAVKDGQFDETSVRKIAAVLGLGADALVALGRTQSHFTMGINLKRGPVSQVAEGLNHVAPQAVLAP